MAVRRLFYLALLTGCLVFCYAYREWFSWFALVGLFCLPLLSLLLSLPAMLRAAVRLPLPQEIPLGTEIRLHLQAACPLPAPPIRCRFRVRCSVTGKTRACAIGTKLPTAHCGTLEIDPKKAYIYDYLGLFRRRIRSLQPLTLQIVPTPVPLENPPQPRQYLSTAWRPKPGGGFAENYDLRQYRPGDNLRQIHWKLAAKTGQLIFREPMVPVQNTLVISLRLPAPGDALDKLLGQLLWLSQSLLEQQLPHEILCLTGRGAERYPVRDAAGMKAAMGALLAAPAAQEDAVLPEPQGAYWHYRIGGEPDAQ